MLVIGIRQSFSVDARMKEQDAPESIRIRIGWLLRVATMKESDGFEEFQETSPSLDVSTTRLNDDSNGRVTTLVGDEGCQMNDRHVLFDQS